MALVSTYSRNATPPGAGWGQMTLGIVLGTGFTLALFLGIARFDRPILSAPPDEIVDLRAVSLPEPPPPPREQPLREPVPLADLFTGLEAAPSDSPVQIAVTPPELEALQTPPLAPPAVIQVGTLFANLQPKANLSAPGDHIFQMAEVDQLPQVLNRVMPHLPSALLEGIKTPRVTLLFVVDARGEVQNVRLIGSSGSPEVDEIVRQVIFEWSFAPAVRKGVKVRCLLQQAMILQITGRSRMEL